MLSYSLYLLKFNKLLYFYFLITNNLILHIIYCFLYIELCFFFCVLRSIDSHVFQDQKTEKRSALVRRHCEQG